MSGRFIRVFGIGSVVAAFAGNLLAGDIEDQECCLVEHLQRDRTPAPPARAWDEKTGRDLRNFAPDRVVDFLRMKLQMRFEDLNDQMFTATETLTFKPIGTPAVSLGLDAVDLKINSVTIGGKPAEFSHDGKRLMLRFDPPLPAGTQQDMVIEYVCDHPTDGMTFTPASDAAPHYTAEVHTQGQTDTNRYWFVCHDFPNERMSTELIVDVPAGFQVSSNGRLVSNKTSGDRTVWHYQQEKPHVAYLVSLVIGKFDVVEIPHSRVPMKVWVPVGQGGNVMQTYGRTGEMIDMFERRFGIAYPWDRYDQLCAKNFGAGGMENTSATTMYPTAILDKTALLDGDLDGLISHELCHQWTGDMITCKSWEHIWLNEGWATYGSALWNEQRYGQDGYLDSVRGNFSVARRDKTTGEIPMVSPIWATPGETFRRPGNPYPKGSSILHMLRMMLGDDVFFKGVALYMNRHALGVAETNDFRYALEEVSGKGLEWFFEQWCYRPGCPELAVKVRYDGEKRDLLVDVEQKQKIDERTPAFRFVLPVVARTATGDYQFDIEVRDTVTAFRVTLDGPPSIVAVDPNLHVLKTIECDKPQAMWMEQARSGGTIVARHEAIEAIAKTNTPETVALLVQIIRDEKERHSLRNTAVDALAGLATDDAKDQLVAILKGGITEARVRSNLVEELRIVDKDKAVEMLAEFAARDESYATRVNAIEALAAHKATDKADVIVPLADFQSQHDNVRSAALSALADLDDARGLDLAVKYAAYGYVDRSRPTAVRAVGKLAKYDKDKAVEFLIGLLNDPESRTRSAAGSALADIGDRRAIEPIEVMSKSHRDPDVRRRAEEWLKRLREGPTTAPSGDTGATTRPERRRRGG